MDLDEWHEQAGRAAYAAFSNGLPMVPWDHIAPNARERWREVARAVLAEGKIEVRPSAELAEQQTRDENERLRRSIKGWQQEAATYRDKSEQQESVNAGLRRAYEHACEQRDKYMRRTVEWREKYTNAGVEAELKIQRGWPDFRDTVAELDELRAAFELLPQGLCGNRSDHAPHLHDSDSLGRFWCHADQTQRLPYALERRKDNGNDETN